MSNHDGFVGVGTPARFFEYSVHLGAEPALVIAAGFDVVSLIVFDHNGNPRVEHGVYRVGTHSTHRLWEPA